MLFTAVIVFVAILFVISNKILSILLVQHIKRSEKMIQYKLVEALLDTDSEELKIVAKKIFNGVD
jgi:hypothetical protein